jgi:hypothetical protein
MTVAELIERLKELPPDMLVVKYRDNMNGTWYWESMDGYLLQEVLVVASDSGLDVGTYYEPRKNEKRPIIEAVEI